MFVTIGSGQGEITEKKSRFIATVKEIHSQEEALGFIEECRKKYWDARHNCYAFVLGENNEIQRFSDDKEPQGTAGKPILDVLLVNDLRNTVIVVTRYFGGILLGTGGLVRAYTSASCAGIEAMRAGGSILPVIKGTSITFSAEYKDIGRMESLASSYDACVISKDYGEKAVYTLALSDDNLEGFKKAATEATSGGFKIDSSEGITFCPSEGGAVFYRF